MPSRGVYQTERKDAVEACFEQHKEECLTAEDCCRFLYESGLTIGLTTVYRTITKLCEIGKLRRYAPTEQGKAASYQYNGCSPSHLHMICRQCGALEHLHCDDAEKFSQHLLKEHQFILDEGQTVLYGICKDCIRKNVRKE